MYIKLKLEWSKEMNVFQSSTRKKKKKDTGISMELLIRQYKTVQLNNSFLCITFLLKVYVTFQISPSSSFLAMETIYQNDSIKVCTRNHGKLEIAWNCFELLGKLKIQLGIESPSLWDCLNISQDELSVKEIISIYRNHPSIQKNKKCP